MGLVELCWPTLTERSLLSCEHVIAERDVGGRGNRRECDRYEI